MKKIEKALYQQSIDQRHKIKDWQINCSQLENSATEKEN